MNVFYMESRREPQKNESAYNQLIFYACPLLRGESADLLSVCVHFYEANSLNIRSWT